MIGSPLASNTEPLITVVFCCTIVGEAFPDDSGDAITGIAIPVDKSKHAEAFINALLCMKPFENSVFFMIDPFCFEV
jgi:hypothetical protein